MKSFFFIFFVYTICECNPTNSQTYMPFFFSHEFLQCVTHDEICTLLLVEAANL